MGFILSLAIAIVVSALFKKLKIFQNVDSELQSKVTTGVWIAFALYAFGSFFYGISDLFAGSGDLPRYLGWFVYDFAYMTYMIVLVNVFTISVTIVNDKINNKLEASSGEEKAKLEQERQKLISDYGVRVSDFLNQYLSAYEIAGGLTKKEAISAFYLYDIYSGMSDTGMYADDSVEGQASEEIRDRSNERTTALAAESGFDRFVPSVLNPYRQTYGYQALKNSVYGYDEDVRAKVSNVLEDTSDYNNSFTKLRSDVKNRYSKAMDRGDYDTANALAYEYDRMVLKAIAPTLQEAGLEQTLKNSQTITKYLEDWVIVPSDYFKDAKGRWVSKLPSETSKGKAFNRRFILDMYGLLDEEED